jgi:hypothetical protein
MPCLASGKSPKAMINVKKNPQHSSTLKERPKTFQSSTLKQRPKTGADNWQEQRTTLLAFNYFIKEHQHQMGNI